MAYNEKFRRNVKEYKDSGHAFREVSETFGADSQCYCAWKKQPGESGKFVNHDPAEHREKICPAKLRGLVRKHPGGYVRTFAGVFGLRPQAVQKGFAKMGIIRKRRISGVEKKEEGCASRKMMAP